MKSLFGNWLLALAVFAAVCWFYWQRDQAQIDGLAAQYGGPVTAVTVTAP